LLVTSLKVAPDGKGVAVVWSRVRCEVVLE
jgi:hypothetical protein